MSIQSQKKNMKEIHRLLSMNLGYIHGERESGPNGAKKQFLTRSAAFLRALGVDLGFPMMEVKTNKAGIACSGEVTLRGLWSEGNGLQFVLTEPCGFPRMLLYRSISHMRDSTGGLNQWLNLDIFQTQDYKQLCSTLLKLKRTEVCHGQPDAA